MRTSLNDWLKFSVALMTVVALSIFATAQESAPTKTEKESPRAKLVKERRLNTIVKSQSAVEGFESVDMFDAIDHGEVEVIIRATSASKSNLIVKNTTDKPLAIAMPAAFSAVPVLRQGFGGGGGLGNQGGGGLGGGQVGFGRGRGQQGIGGGFGGGQQGGGFGGGGGGFGGGGFGGGGGVFNIPAGRIGKVSVNTVCLEEGKPDPQSRIDYKVQPLADLNDDPKIFEMIQMLATDEIAQPVVQAAAWHMSDNLARAIGQESHRANGWIIRTILPSESATLGPASRHRCWSTGRSTSSMVEEKQVRRRDSRIKIYFCSN